MVIKNNTEISFVLFAHFSSMITFCKITIKYRNQVLTEQAYLVLHTSLCFTSLILHFLQN